MRRLHELSDRVADRGDRWWNPMSTEDTFVIVGASLAGAKAAEALRRDAAGS